MKFKNLSILLSLLSSLFLSSCRTVSGRSKLMASDEANLDYFDRRLGSSFDSETFQKLPHCLDTRNFVYSGANTSDFTFYRDYDYNQIIDVAGGGLYGKASLLGLVSAKVQGDMATSLATTDDSATFVYQFNLRGKSALLDEFVFNSRGSSVFRSGDLLAFREQCGNQYVERVALGSQLFVGVKYVFNSKETKQEFKLKLSIELFWGLIKKSKTWTKEQKDMLKNVVVSVEAYQIGGDPRKLEDLKAKLNRLSCFGDDTDACADAVDRLLLYGREELPGQLNNMELSDQPYSGPAILNVGMKNYRDERIYDPSSRKWVLVKVDKARKPSEELSKLLSQLDALRVELKISQSRGRALEVFRLSDDERRNLRLSLQEIDGALVTLENVIEGNCKKAMTNVEYLNRCSSETATIKKQAAKANESLQIPNRT